MDIAPQAAVPIRHDHDWQGELRELSWPTNDVVVGRSSGDRGGVDSTYMDVETDPECRLFFFCALHDALTLVATGFGASHVLSTDLYVRVRLSAVPPRRKHKHVLAGAVHLGEGQRGAPSHQTAG